MNAESYSFFNLAFQIVIVIFGVVLSVVWYLTRRSVWGEIDLLKNSKQDIKVCNQIEETSKRDRAEIREELKEARKHLIRMDKKIDRLMWALKIENNDPNMDS